MPDKQQLEELKQSVTYTFQYDTDFEAIDLNTLLLSQIHFSTVLNEIKNEVAPDSNLSIKIKPLEKGSVPFDIILDVSFWENLFSQTNVANLIGYASGIVTVLVGVIQIRKDLKGKKPKKIEIKNDKVIITSDDVTIEVDRKAYEIYEKNPVIDQALRKSFKAIEEDEGVSGIKILDKNKNPLVNIPRSSFDDLTEPNEIFEEQVVKDDLKRESLTVIKLVFEKGYKWQFYMKSGRKISAYVKDDNFMKIIDKGERFAKGDTLIVDLEIEKVFDKDLGIFVDSDYNVTKVVQHIPRAEQTNLFGDGEKK